MHSSIIANNTQMVLAILITFFTSLFLTGLIIPKILLIAFRKKLFDEVNERKIHKGTVPRLGGIAFMPSIVFAMALVVGIANIPAVAHYIPEMDASYFRSICFGMCGLMLLFLVGIADDLIGVVYRAKFVVQLISAALLVLGGVWIDNLHGFCGMTIWPVGCGAMLTILVTVFFVNAINLIDGIDGLASGLTSVALLFYGITFAMCGDVLNACLSFATMATLIQFFYYNVFGNPVMGKKIFMGDTGALCIGFILTYLSVTMSRIPDFHFAEFNPLIVAFAPMLVPCLDVLRVFFNRIRNGVSPFMPDKTHIHHKIMAMGVSPKHTMVSILLISTVIVMVNIALSPYVNSAILLTGDIVLWASFNHWLTLSIRKRA